MQIEQQVRILHHEGAVAPNWVTNTSVLWSRRQVLVRTAAIAFLLSIAIAFLIPKRYDSTAQIMPPDSSGASTALLAALAGRGEFGGLGSLAGTLLGARTTGPLFVNLLRSGTVSGDLIDRFQLQHVYRKRYRVDAAKKLARNTSIVEDKKSGVISITVTDSDPRRARDLAQAYLDELNLLVNHTNTSSARQERIFIEHRLNGAQADLERAQHQMSDFASTHTAIDIKEQTRATVDAAARLEGQIIFEQSELDSLKQVYGDDNVRVRASRARIAALHHQLDKISGTSAPLVEDDPHAGSTESTIDRTAEEYPSLRQIPRLAVPYADIYRQVRIQETVYEMLTQQYELARIQEAKDVPVVRVIDYPGIPEKKSFPPRLLLTVLLTCMGIAAAGGIILLQFHWTKMNSSDERKALAHKVFNDFRRDFLRTRSVLRRRSDG